MASVTCAVGDGIARLTLNRPAEGNAIDPALAGELRDHARALGADPSVRAVVLAGAGATFCVGGDVGYFAAADDPRAALGALAGDLHDALRALLTLDAPIIARVHGAAAGAGLSLVCLADLAIAATDTTFVSAYTGIGLSPDGGQSWLLPRLVGARRATEMILTNRRVSGEEAAAIGLVTEAVAPQELDARVDALAARIAAGPTTAFGAATRLLHDGTTTPLDAHLDAERDQIAALAESPAGREGVAAFLEKRRPDFAAAVAS